MNAQFKVGDKVFALKGSFPRTGVLGTHAEYVALKEDSIALVPDNISLVDAASVPLVALTAWQAFHSTDPKPSQRILIFSASSGVGLSAVQFAKNLGQYVVGTAGAKNLELVRSFGADEASSAGRPCFATAAQMLMGSVQETAAPTPCEPSKR